MHVNFERSSKQSQRAGFIDKDTLKRTGTMAKLKAEVGPVRGRVHEY